MIGSKFGRWTVLSNPARGKVLCRCACGKEKAVAVKSLRRGVSTSCGCFRGQLLAVKNYRHGNKFRSRETKEYRAWRHAQERCFDANNTHYPQYGGRGIVVCERWLGESGFRNFITDMGLAPSRHHSLDRKRVNDNYSLDNCRWALPEEQGNNTRRNVFVEYQDKQYTISQLARSLGVNRRYLAKLVAKGVSVDEALRRVSRNTSTNYSPRNFIDYPIPRIRINLVATGAGA